MIEQGWDGQATASCRTCINRLESRHVSDSNPGLYDPAFERDSCGVGFVADMGGQKSHATIQSGLLVLKNLQHRGACGCDQDTGDGAGSSCNCRIASFAPTTSSFSDRLPAAGDYGVAFVFLPREPPSG